MSSKHVVDLRGGRPAPRRETRPAARNSPPPRRDKRVSPIRMRRRRARALVGLLFVLAVAGIVYGVHALSYLPRLTIGHITVNGTEKLEPSLVEAFVWSQLQDGSYHYLSRSDIFVYPRAVIEHALTASLPRIKSAQVALASPLSRELVVTIVERHPYAKWCENAASTSSACYAMDDTGYIFADASSATPSDFQTPYVFTGGLSQEPIGATFIPGHMPGVLSLLRILGQQGGSVPSEVRIEDDQDISILYPEGYTLKVSFGEDADTVARNLKLVLSSDALAGKLDQLEYVDLRFGNRVYYKLKGDAAETQQ